MKHTPTPAMISSAKRGVEMSKGPNLSNNSIPEPSLKGGKKIASGQQISDDHVKAMAQYHAAHTDGCPQGDDAEGCDDLLWGGPAGAGWSASRCAVMDATSLSEDTGPKLDTLLAAEGQFSIELYTRPDLVLEGKTDLKRGEDGLIWAPILRSGTLACRPDPTAANGRKNEPLVFVSGHATDPKQIGLQDIVDAFNDNAVQHVTIPKTHRNNEFENTGFIRKLKIADSTIRPGEKVILAGHDFLDHDAESRVESGLIANRSCGLLHGYQNTETGKTYPHALEHVALTNKPWVTGMEAYGSDTFTNDREIVALMLSDGQTLPAPEQTNVLPKVIFSTATAMESFVEELKLADVIWNDEDGQPSLVKIQSGLYQALQSMGGSSPYFDENSVYFQVRDVRPNSALVTVDYGGSDPEDACVIPFSWTDGKLVLGDFSDWKFAHEAWVVDDDAQQDKDEIQQLMEQNTQMSLADAELIVATYLDVPAATRNKAKKGGDTLSDGSYPITNQMQANKAWILRNNGKAPAATVIAHIRKQVAKYKLKMPGSSSSKTNASLPLDPRERAITLRLSQGLTPATPGGTTMGLTPEMLDSLNLSDEAKEVLQRQIVEDTRRDAELAKYRDADKASGRETRLSRAKEIFGDSNVATLKVINELLLADDHQPAVTLLSTDTFGTEVKHNLSISQVVDLLLASFPKKDAGTEQSAFSAISLLENPLSGRPDLNPDPADVPGAAKTQLSGDDLIAKWKKDLPGGLELALPTTTQA